MRQVFNISVNASYLLWRSNLTQGNCDLSFLDIASYELAFYQRFEETLPSVQIRKYTTLIFLQLNKVINVPQVITYIFMVALSVWSFAATETAICQITRRQRKSLLLLTFDAGATRSPSSRAVELPFRHGYPREAIVTLVRWSLIIPRLNGFLRMLPHSVGIFSSRRAAFFDPRNFLWECQRTAGHAYGCVLTSVETTLRNAKICPSNLHEMRVNKQTKKVLPCDTYRWYAHSRTTAAKVRRQFVCTYGKLRV